MNRGYKVVRYRKGYGNGPYLSATVWGRIAHYAVGQPTVPEPDCGPLAVFRSQYEATQFRHQLTRYAVSEYDFLVFAVEYVPYTGERRALWSDDDESNWRADFPTGTVLASEVTLLERVDV